MACCDKLVTVNVYTGSAMRGDVLAYGGVVGRWRAAEKDGEQQPGGV